MPRKPLLTLRIDDETRAKWQAKADDLGYSLSELIRIAVDDLIDREAPKAKPKKKPTVKELRGVIVAKTTRSPFPNNPRNERSVMCEHRVPPSAFCSRCD